MTDETFNTLGKDIEIVDVGNGYYDRQVLSGDFVQLTGLDALRNGCKVAILTLINELKDNPTYSSFGNPALLYVKQNNTLLARTAIKEAVKKVLNNIRRIQSVDVLNVDVVGIPFNITVYYSCTSIDDQTVNGSVTTS